MKSLLDNKPPRTYMYLHVKRTIVQEEADRKVSIQRENFRLLHRIANIMKTKGYIDNVNNYQARR